MKMPKALGVKKIPVFSRLALRYGPDFAVLRKARTTCNQLSLTYLAGLKRPEIDRELLKNPLLFSSILDQMAKEITEPAILAAIAPGNKPFLSSEKISMLVAIADHRQASSQLLSSLAKFAADLKDWPLLEAVAGNPKTLPLYVARCLSRLPKEQFWMKKGIPAAYTKNSRRDAEKILANHADDRAAILYELKDLNQPLYDFLTKNE